MTSEARVLERPRRVSTREGREVAERAQSTYLDNTSRARRTTGEQDEGAT